jgi:hypothetical protein
LVAEGEAGEVPSWYHDQDLVIFPDPDWPSSPVDALKVYFLKMNMQLCIVLEVIIFIA